MINYNEYIKFISEMFDDYGKKLTGLATKEWVDVGEKYGFENVCKIILSLRASPDATGFIIRVSEIEKALVGTKKDRASLAWAKLMSIIDKCSARRFVFDDPIIHAVVESMGGMDAVCTWTLDALSFKETEFCKHYEMFEKSPAALQNIPSFLAASGNIISPFFPVGDEELCKLVYKKQHKLLIGGSDGKRIGDK